MNKEKIIENLKENITIKMLEKGIESEYFKEQVFRINNEFFKKVDMSEILALLNEYICEDFLKEERRKKPFYNYTTKEIFEKIEKEEKKEENNKKRQDFKKEKTEDDQVTYRKVKNLDEFFKEIFK